MNYDMTISDYSTFVSNLKIHDFIIYYFVAYIFLVTVQKILGREIDVTNRTNPKILLSLSFLYFYIFLNSIVVNLLSGSSLLECVVISAVLGLFFTYLSHSLIFSKTFGFFHFLPIYLVKKKANLDITEKRVAASANINNSAITQNCVARVEVYRREFDYLLIDSAVFFILFLHFCFINKIIAFCIVVFFYPFAHDKILKTIAEIDRIYSQDSGKFFR